MKRLFYKLTALLTVLGAGLLAVAAQWLQASGWKLAWTVTGNSLTYPGGALTDASTAPATGSATWQMLPQYLRGMKNALQRRKFLVNRLGQKTPIGLVGGTHFELRMLTGGIMGIGWNNGSGALARPGSTTGITPKANPSNIFSVLQFDLNTINRARSNEVVFQDAMVLELKAKERDAGKIINQALYLPKSGVLGRVAGSPAAGVITLDNDGLINTLASDLTKYFHVGLPVCAIRSDTGAVRQNGLLVTAIDKTAGTITVTDAGTLDGAAGHGNTADNDWLVIGHLDSVSSSYNQAVTGISSWLGAHAAATDIGGTVWGLDRTAAANALWRPMRVTPAQGEALEATLRRAKSAAFKEGGDEGNIMDPNQPEGFIWLTSPEGYDKYGAGLLATRQFQVPTSPGVQGGYVNLGGGFVGLWADGVPMLADSDCPCGRYFGMRLAEDWDIYGSLEFQPVFLPQGGMLQKLPNFPLYIIELYASFELGCSMPNRNVEVSGVPMTVY